MYTQKRNQVTRQQTFKINKNIYIHANDDLNDCKRKYYIIEYHIRVIRIQKRYKARQLHIQPHRYHLSLNHEVFRIEFEYAHQKVLLRANGH